MATSIYNDLFGIPERAKTINAKRKGNDNEYLLANVLSNWTGFKFGRVPSSGGLRWEGESRFIGDVVVQDPEINFPFTIETKSYRKLILKNGNFSKKVGKFWDQCIEDCKRSGKMPMLIMRENGMPKEDWHIFFDLRHFCFKNLSLSQGLGKAFGLEEVDNCVFLHISMQNLSKIPYEKFLSLIKR